MKEYGGYIGIEAYGKEYFDTKILNADIVRLNAARFAIIEAIKSSGSQKLYVPIYMCKSVYDVLEKYDIHYEKYNIDNNFMPIVDSYDFKNDIILVTNYYGIQGYNFYNDNISKYRNIIFDNTQSFFSPPVLRDNVYNVYSPRKFFGVPDGAYMIGERIRMLNELQQDHSLERCIHLLKSLEYGTNGAYKDYLHSEESIDLSHPYRMSIITRTMLKNIDYDVAYKKRAENFNFLKEQLRDINELDLSNSNCVPMVYPLYFTSWNDDFRQYMVENKIYIPQWWKWVLNDENANTFEHSLSTSLFPLPIDQRYTINDMDYILQVVRNYKEKKWK